MAMNKWMAVNKWLAVNKWPTVNKYLAVDRELEMRADSKWSVNDDGIARLTGPKPF